MAKKIFKSLIIMIYILLLGLTANAGYVSYKTMLPIADTYIDTGVPSIAGTVITYPNGDKSFGTSKTLFLSPVQQDIGNRAKAYTSYGLIRFDLSNWTDDEIKKAACIKLRLTTYNDVDETRTGYTGGSPTSLYYDGADYRFVAANDEPIKDVLQVLGLQQGITLAGDVETPINYKTSWNENTTWNNSGGLKLNTIGNYLRGATVDPVRKNTTYYIDVTDYVVFNKLYDDDVANRRYAAFKIQKMLQGWGWPDNKFGNGFSIYSSKADDEQLRPALIMYDNDAKGKLQIIADNFNFGDIKNLIYSLTLPNNIEGASVVWKSDNTDAISDSGVVNIGEYDKDFGLEATFTKDGVSVSKIFSGTVKSKNYIISASEEIGKTLTFNKISQQEINKISSDLNLIKSLAPQHHDVKIKWSSSKNEVISSETGKVIRQNNDTTVLLTATLFLEGLEKYTFNLYFSVVVLGNNDTPNGGVISRPVSQDKIITPSVSVQSDKTVTIEEVLQNYGKEQLFNDVSLGFWGTKYLNYLKKKNVVSGDENGYYHPNNSITREESLKIVFEALGVKTSNSDLNFTDVNKDKWYYPYISIGKQSNIIKGITETEFGVGKPIKRQDLAVMVCNALKQKGISFKINDFTKFPDDEFIDNYAKESVYYLKSIGILLGDSIGSFLPQNLITRAEMAKIMCLIILKYGI